MGKSSSRVNQSLGGLMLLGLLLCPATAFAHKLNVFATVEGSMIQGNAYFPGGVAAQHIDIIVRDPSGRELGRTTTDEHGDFLFTAHERVDHCLHAETVDGHSAEFTVRASALPENLPGADPAGQAPQSDKDSTRQAATRPPDSASSEAPSQAGKPDLQELGRKIDALQRQVYDSEERLRFRDFLGGIGFILGLAGVALYFKARQSGR